MIWCISKTAFKALFILQTRLAEKKYNCVMESLLFANLFCAPFL